MPRDRYELLLDELEELRAPTRLATFFADTLGRAGPGLAVFPAVTILAHGAGELPAADTEESWTTGDLLALHPSKPNPASAIAGPIGERVYFTPLGTVTKPRLRISRVAEGGLGEAFRLTPTTRWGDFELQFAILPWQEGTDDAASSEEVLRKCGEELRFLVPQLHVAIEIGGKTASLRLEFGLDLRPLPQVVEGMRFAINHAIALVEPFFVRLSLSERVLRRDLGVVLERQEAILRFTVSEQALSQLRARVGLGHSAREGFRVFPHALALANVDLKAWPASDSFDDFVRETGMEPLGPAGVFPYRPEVGLKLEALGDCVFSVEIDPEKLVLHGHTVAGNTDAAHERQLVYWMSDGPALNGLRCERTAANEARPLEKRTEAYNRAATIVPCFGSVRCVQPKSLGSYSALAINYAPAPQVFAFGDGIVAAVSDLLERLGCRHIRVERPRAEARLVDGVRRRVIVVRCRNEGGRRLDPSQVAAITAFVDARTPPWVCTLVEEVE